MKKLAIVAMLAATLAACGQDKPAEQAAAPAPAEIAHAAPQVDHYYSLKDGFEYGYERAVSQEEISQGQAATTLIMVKYAGQRDGKYQVYQKEGQRGTVFECESPCEFVKIMTFAQGGHVGTERMRATEGTIAWTIMADAIGGKMEPFVGDNQGQKYTVWFDEKTGAKRIPVEG